MWCIYILYYRMAYGSAQCEAQMMSKWIPENRRPNEKLRLSGSLCYTGWHFCLKEGERACKAPGLGEGKGWGKVLRWDGKRWLRARDLKGGWMLEDWSCWRIKGRAAIWTEEMLGDAASQITNNWIHLFKYVFRQTFYKNEQRLVRKPFVH